MTASKELLFTKSLIQEAGELIMGMKKVAGVSFKTPKDLVTEADVACETFLVERVKKSFPEDAILSEENYSQTELGDGRTWVIDPIDGTVNYSRGIPLYCISIGLVQNKRPILGCIYAPELNQLFWAEKGQGAFCNAEPIAVSKAEQLSQSLVYIMDFNVQQESDPDNQKMLNEVQMLSSATMRTRILGSAAIEAAYVASGKIDAYICQPHFWDVAAGIILTEEAGGEVSQTNGESYDPKRRDILISNGQIHQELVELMG